MSYLFALISALLIIDGEAVGLSLIGTDEKRPKDGRVRSTKLKGWAEEERPVAKVMIAQKAHEGGKTWSRTPNLESFADPRTWPHTVSTFFTNYSWYRW